MKSENRLHLALTCICNPPFRNPTINAINARAKHVDCNGSDTGGSRISKHNPLTLFVSNDVARDPFHLENPVVSFANQVIAFHPENPTNA